MNPNTPALKFIFLLLVLAPASLLGAVINSVSAVYDRSTDTVQFTFNTFGAYEFKRVYLDTDEDTNTGFCGGFDFLIENGELYQFDGVDADCDWAWIELCPAFAIGDREDRTIWSINAENVGNLKDGLGAVFELEEIAGLLPRQESPIVTGEVSAFPVQDCSADNSAVTVEVVSAAARVDLSSHQMEIEFESRGTYLTKAVMIDADNNPGTGHVNFLSSELRGFDVIVSNGLVSVYTGNDGSDDFEWEQVGVAEQAVGIEAQADEITWTFDTCELESYLPTLNTNGGALFYLKDSAGNSYVTFESSLVEYVSEQDNLQCETAIDPSSLLLAVVTAENLDRRLSLDNAATEAFLDDEGLGVLLGSSPGFVANDGTQSSGGGGGLSLSVLGLMAWLAGMLGRRTVRKRKVLSLVVRLIGIPATLCLGIISIDATAQETPPQATTFDYTVQFTEPRTGKFWVDVRDADSAEQQQLMQAVLSSALIRVNDSIWNDLDDGLPIRVENCGAANAFYNLTTREIILCWELYEGAISAYARLAIGEDNPEDFARGFMVFTMYHELAHAISDFREIPSAGNNESNVDGLATVMAVEQEFSSFAFVTALLFRAIGGSSFGDVHPGGDDRAGDLICWVIGGDQRQPQLSAYQYYRQLFNNEGRDCVTEYQANRQVIVDLFPDFVR